MFTVWLLVKRFIDSKTGKLSILRHFVVVIIVGI